MLELVLFRSSVLGQFPEEDSGPPPNRRSLQLNQYHFRRGCHHRPFIVDKTKVIWTVGRRSKSPTWVCNRHYHFLWFCSLAEISFFKLIWSFGQSCKWRRCVGADLKTALFGRAWGLCLEIGFGCEVVGWTKESKSRQRQVIRFDCALRRTLFWNVHT
jgi:hypothetical protein